MENSTVQVLIAVSVIIAAFILARVIRNLLFTLANKSKYSNSPIGQAFIKSIGRTATILFLTLAYFIGKPYLDLPDSFDELLDLTNKILITLTVGIWAYYLIEIPNAFLVSLNEKSGSSTGKMLAPIVKGTLRSVVIALILASLYQTITEKSITPFLASLGILGAAIALASQDTFKNFFGSFVLASDKPFEIGERILVDNYDGVIEGIGIRSTRIRTLDGHLVNIPNGMLANKTIQNIGKRPYIRRVTNITITYDTTPEKIDLAVDILRKLLENHEGMNEEYPPRVYFKELQSYYFEIMMIYWYFPPAYWDFMEFTQRINCEIVKQFNEAGIRFAFPTQTIQLEQVDNQ